MCAGDRRGRAPRLDHRPGHRALIWGRRWWRGATGDEAGRDVRVYSRAAIGVLSGKSATVGEATPERATAGEATAERATPERAKSAEGECRRGDCRKGECSEGDQESAVCGDAGLRRVVPHGPQLSERGGTSLQRGARGPRVASGERHVAHRVVQ